MILDKHPSMTISKPLIRREDISYPILDLAMSDGIVHTITFRIHQHMLPNQPIFR